MRQTVVGIFDSESEAQNAIQKLINDGFTHDNIDISDNMGNYQNQNYQNKSVDKDEDFGDKISNFFSDLFGNDNDTVRNYTHAAKKGCVVTVHAESEEEAERAVDILDLYGAVDVDERAQSYQSNLGSTSMNNDTYVSSSTGFLSDESLDTAESIQDRAFNTENMRSDLSEDDIRDRENSIPIVEEQMNIGKREVETGGVRVRSRIVERPVEESLRLRVERVHVERNPVNRPATEADLNSFREGTIEMTQREEVPVVSKEARVVEEVSVGKQVDERTETVRDTVRNTEVDVEDFTSDNSRYRDRENLRDDL